MQYLHYLKSGYNEIYLHVVYVYTSISSSPVYAFHAWFQAMADCQFRQKKMLMMLIYFRK
jgi:hypothetical protein